MVQERCDKNKVVFKYKALKEKEQENINAIWKKENN